MKNFEKARSSMFDGISKNETKINITPDVAEYFNGRCYIDLLTSGDTRIDVMRFTKENDGISIEYAGTDLNGLNYRHTNKDKYAKAIEQNYTYFGQYMKYVLSGISSYVKEISQKQYDHCISLVETHKTIKEANSRHVKFLIETILSND